MKELSKKVKNLILYLIATVRIGGVAAFLFFHPFIAYSINALFDMGDGPINKHILKIDPLLAQILDKIYDLWLYTAAAAYTLFNPQPVITPLLTVLYIYRLIGQTIFFVTKNKNIFVYFPNIFENVFLFAYFLNLVSANWFFENKLFFCLGIIFWSGLKIVHEVSLHHRNETIFDNIILPFFQRRNL
jgi:hypothetical protein